MNDSYESLRDWYLARLRRQAIDEANAGRLTPMSLVRADAEVVAQIIAARLGEDEQNSRAVSKTDHIIVSVPNIQKASRTWLAIVISLVSGLLAVAAFLWVTNTENVTILVLTLLAVAAITATVGCVVALRLFDTQVIATLDSIARSLENILPPEIARKFSNSSNVLARISGPVTQLGRLYKEATVRERAIVDYSPQLVCSLDREKRILASNPAVTKRLGYAADEMTNSYLVAYALEEDVPKTLKALDVAKNAKGAVELINRMRTSDSRIIHIEWTIEWSEKGDLFFCSGQDVTERIQLEQLKQDFVAMITHDMRSPLSSMVAASQLIQTGDIGSVSDEIQQRLRGIETTGKRLLSLVSELLDIDRLEAGLLELERGSVQLDAINQTAIESLRSLADTKQIEIDAQETGLSVLADELRLIQVITNLLSNAIKFSPRKSTINIATTTDGDGLIEVSVTDKGRGIQEEDMVKIFDRFKQIEIADSALKGGSGLGLAICKAIVTAHGGQIGVRSKLKEGSTFWFKLPNPIAIAVAADEDPPQEKLLDGEPSPTQKTG